MANSPVEFDKLLKRVLDIARPEHKPTEPSGLPKAPETSEPSEPQKAPKPAKQQKQPKPLKGLKLPTALKQLRPREASESSKMPKAPERPHAPESPDKPDVPAAQPAGSDTRAELYALLEGYPERADDGEKRMLYLCRERDAGRGEDCILAARAKGRLFMGAFDGCGGSGAKVYPAYGGHTGAWVASRAATAAAEVWFRDEAPSDALGPTLERALKACRGGDPDGQVLMGSLSREFPTTVAAFVKATDADETEFFWCGDSRCYVLEADGLYQVTADDAAIQDAMRALREDAPMTNVACASRPFKLHRVMRKLDKPAVILAATDGCFGYLPSPMAFETMLLETLQRSASAQEWAHRLDERLGRISGDDYTMAAWIHRFATFRELKRAMRARLAFMRAHYPPTDASDAALTEQWDAYRAGYERALGDTNTEGRRVGR